MTNQRPPLPSRDERLAAACTTRSCALAGVLAFAGALAACRQASSAPASGSDSSPVVGTLVPSAGATTQSATPVAQNQQQTPTTRKYMLSHFADSVRVRQALVAGKLSEAQSAAALVANDTWSPRLRGDYQAPIQAVRDSARALQSATSLPVAAAALGTLGEKCAWCHLKFGGPGSPVAPEQLDESADPGMVAHALATERLWQGLIAPSDESWRSGAEALVAAPALDSDVTEVAATARRLRELAQKGTSAGQGHRGGVFGEVLSTCAVCHERLGINVALPPR